MPVGEDSSLTLDLSKAEGNILVDVEIIKKMQLSSEFLSSLPRRDAYQQLKESIAKYYKTSSNSVVLGNGSDELIEHIAWAKQGGVSLTLTPSFESLFEVNKKFNYRANTFSLLEKSGFRYTNTFHNDFLSNIKKLKPDIIWLCSPVNPTGTIIGVGYILDIATKFTDSWIVIDTAFIDMVDRKTALEYVKLIQSCDNVLVLNSFSKSWGISALRLGFLLASKEVAHNIARRSVMFNVNSVAVEFGQYCISNNRYRSKEFSRIHRHLNIIRSTVGSMPQFDLIANSDMNIFCLRSRTSPDLSKKLLRLGIKTKPLSNMPGMNDMGYCRVLVPRKKNDLKVLLEALNTLQSYYQEHKYML